MSYNPSAATIGEIRTTAAFSAPAGFLLSYGQSVLRSTYAALFSALTTAATVTFSNSGGELLCTWSGHPFAASGAYYTPISFTAGTSTPTGITAGTVYFVKPISSSTFKLSTTAGGGNIAYTNSGTGTQTATAQKLRAETILPDLRGRVAAFLDNMGGTAASRLTNSVTGGVNGIILGGSGGEQVHTLIPTEIGDTQPLDATGGDNTYDANGGASSAHNNVQPTIILNAIIYTGV